MGRRDAKEPVEIGAAGSDLQPIRVRGCHGRRGRNSEPEFPDQAFDRCRERKPEESFPVSRFGRFASRSSFRRLPESFGNRRTFAREASGNFLKSSSDLWGSISTSCRYPSLLHHELDENIFSRVIRA